MLTLAFGALSMSLATASPNATTRAAAIRAAFGYDALPTKTVPDFVTPLYVDPLAHPGGQNEGITPNTTVLTWTLTEVRDRCNMHAQALR